MLISSTPTTCLVPPFLDKKSDICARPQQTHLDKDEIGPDLRAKGRAQGLFHIVLRRRRKNTPHAFISPSD